MRDYAREGIDNRHKPRRKRSVAGIILPAFFRVLLAALLILVTAAGIVAYVNWNEIIGNAPDITGVTFEPGQSATYIYDQEGNQVQKLTLPEANRDIVSLEDVPADLQHAVVAIEDARFYRHHGIDPVGIARALVTGIKTRSFSQGASTITQQLLKNTVFPDWTKETTFRERIVRKIQEQYLAVKLEKNLTKEQILEHYLNLINLGAGCYGVQAAAFRYFGKAVSDLNLAECSVIAGITQNPAAYNPIAYPENNQKRRKMVLDAMLDQKYIDKKRYDEAMEDDVYERIRENTTQVDTTASVYSFYQDALISQVMEDLQDELAYTYQQAYRAVYSGGLRIYSAQDAAIQKICDEEFENPENFPEGTMVGIDYALSIQGPDRTVTDYGNSDLKAWVRANRNPDFNLMYEDAQSAGADARAYRESVVGEGDTVLGERVTITPQPQASCVVIDQSSGLVAALVGGRGEKEASLTLNRASYTTRQPGSTFKILTVYAPAIEEGRITLASTIVDEPYSYGWGAPVNNATRQYQGEVTIRRAIVESLNVPAVKLLTEIGPQTGYDFAKKLGISTLTDHMETADGVLTDVGQTLALGGISRGVTNLDLTGAYAAIANLGHFYQPKFYTRVLDRHGEVLLDNTNPASRTVMKESTAQLLTSAMEDVIRDEAGTAHGLIDPGAMGTAGKTGTTSEWRDSWFVGYTPYYTCGIWAGYDNNEILPDEGRYHSFSRILWNSVMKRISSQDTPVPFQTTPDVVSIPVCRTSHMAASVRCADVYDELFAKGTEPQNYCSVHGDGSPVHERSGGIGGSVAAGKPAGQSADGTDQTENSEPAESAGQEGNSGQAGNAGPEAIVIFNSDEYTWTPQQSQIPEAAQQGQIPEAAQQSQIPEAAQQSQIPEAAQQSQIPEAAQEYSGGNALSREQQPEIVILS